MLAKGIMFNEFGNPQDVLKVETKQIRPLTEEEILVRMSMCPINPSDLIPIKGSYAHRISLPTIPGYEGVGIIEDVGQSVSKKFIGQRVLPLRGEGTWQEFVKTSASLAVPIPNSINDYTAAQLYINPLTAWVICTEMLKLKRNDTLIVNACGSSIGRIFAQLSRVLGFRLIAVTRSSTYTEELLKLGAYAVINTTTTFLTYKVMELTNGRGATAAIDSVGGEAGSTLAFCVQPNGTLVSIGLLSGIPINWAKFSEISKVTVKLFHLRHWNTQVSVRKWQDTFAQLIELVNHKQLVLMKPEAQFNFVNIQEAVRVAESSTRNKGKIFITGHK